MQQTSNKNRFETYPKFRYKNKRKHKKPAPKLEFKSEMIKKKIKQHGMIFLDEIMTS